jgi:hypothetical protein
VLPLALLPYLISLGLWLSSTLAGFILVLRRIAPHPVTIWLGLAFPGTFLNLIHGQNGFLSAMLLGAGLLLLEPAPIAAGILFGLLSYKPHFVILVPLALAAGRRWRALLSLGITSACLLLASVLLLGADVFTAFRDNLPATLQVLETGRLGGNVFPLLSKMSTLFAALILAGSPLWLAQILQVALMLATAAIVAWVWFREASPAVRAAVLVLGVLLFPPYEFLYDLAILALPIAWLGWEGVSEGWLPGEQTVLFVCFLTPMLTPMLAKWLNLQITPLVLALLLAVALRRLRLRPHIMEI